MKKNSEVIKVGILPGMLDLYKKLCPGLSADIMNLFERTVAGFQTDGLEFFLTDIVFTEVQVHKECEKLLSSNVDFIVVALAPYCPSGVLVPGLMKVNIPVLLWPIQEMFKLEPENYDSAIITMNHGIHAVQDLANVLRKFGRNFGVIHGHLKQDNFRGEFVNWAKAARAVQAFQRANPIQVGGHFEDMLDLQIDSDDFVKKVGIKNRVISLGEFNSALRNVSDDQIKERIESYRSVFEISDNFDNAIPVKTAKGENALRAIMDKYNSCACGLNFLPLCNEKHISDPLHMAGSVLMSDGYGYAGEGDWITAGFVYAMQQAFGKASFSEIFSAGYEDNRLVLMHWGEGNFAMARKKPRLNISSCVDKQEASFAIVDFEFKPADATLINLNSTPQGQGQLISITGRITDDHLPKAGGPRAVFKPDIKDVRELLTDYAYNGGSHHLVLVNGNGTAVIEKLCRFTGWKHIYL